MCSSALEDALASVSGLTLRKDDFTGLNSQEKYSFSHASIPCQGMSRGMYWQGYRLQGGRGNAV